MVMLQRPDPSSGSPSDAKEPVLLVAALADIGVTGEVTAAAAARSLGAAQCLLLVWISLQQLRLSCAI